MKNVLGKIFAIWAAIVFVVTLIPALLCILLTGWVNEPGRTEIFRKTSKGWMLSFFFLTGCSLRVKGLENFQKGKSYIVTCNHNSLMDIPLTTPFIPGPNKTIAKVEMAKIPLFGIIYRRGSVLVDRKDKNSRKNSFKAMKEVLRQRMHMCIYPEGTRNKTDQPLKEFYDGAFRLAAETGHAIIPALIFNTKTVLPSDKGFFFWPSEMRLHFLPEIPVVQGGDADELKNRVFKVMENYLLAEG